LFKSTQRTYSKQQVRNRTSAGLGAVVKIPHPDKHAQL